MEKQKKAFSLVELIIIVLFLGIFAAVTVPRLNMAIITKQKADTFAHKLATDLRRTRRLAISDAAGNTNGFALIMVGSSPYSSYRIDNRDTGATIDTQTIDSQIECTGGNTFKFGPLGNLLSGSGSTLTITGDDKSFTITIVSATGMIRCIEN